ncbi:MAG: putative lipid II flippase FtsW [Candidatus Omnitrophica bacterium]|nr:putative lipid II flippase FtsW [Candidatus Omnitrophota bacterium]
MRSIRISIASIVVILLSLGIVMIYSSSGVYARQTLGDSAYFLFRHLLFLSIGIMAMLFIMAMDYRRLQEYSKPMLIFIIILLILVLIPHIGKSTFGARRWFKLGPFGFQPSEFAKLAMLVYVADFLSRKKEKILSLWEGFIPIVCVMGLVCLLIVKEPDLGNSVLIAMITLIMIFIAGANIWHIVSLGLMAVPALYYLVFRVPYRLARITAFWNPNEDIKGIGFQLYQSQIALGSGGFWGIGLGQSKQKLLYLPAAHTDFILSIIGEEMGLLGTLLVVILFAALIWQGARIAKRANNPFGYYLALGIVAMLGLQAVINIGVNIGALPTKGLPLPFISYGGSALIFNLMAIGLLLNISRVQDL